MASCYRLVVAGAVPQLLAEQIRARFGPVDVRGDAGSTVLAGSVPDQPALRALLGLVWDVGVDVRALVLRPQPDGAAGSG